MDTKPITSSVDNLKNPPDTVLATLKPKKKRVVTLESEKQLENMINPLKLTEHAKSFVNRLVPYSLRTSIAKELLDNGKTLRYVSKYTGLDKEILCRIKKGEMEACNSFVDQIKKDESGKITYLANSILDSVSHVDLEKASLLQKITSASILIDKRRLIDGESTENVNYLGKLDVLVNGAKKADAMLAKLESAESK